MRHFVLSGPVQTHDVHTKLRLQHPGGEATQLHKCIVSAASGEAARACTVHCKCMLLLSARSSSYSTLWWVCS